jgi:hypothetical protein
MIAPLILFCIRLHSVLEERIAIVRIEADRVLTIGSRGKQQAQGGSTTARTICKMTEHRMSLRSCRLLAIFQASDLV